MMPTADHASHQVLPVCSADVNRLNEYFSYHEKSKYSGHHEMK